MHVLFGSDIDEVMRVKIYERNHDQQNLYIEKDCTLSEAIEETFDQTIDALRMRVPNPLWYFMYAMTGKCFSFSRQERISDSNSTIIREKIRDYVRKRVSGEVKSDVGG